MAKNSYQQIVEDEKKILDELQKNANKSINDVATSCGFSRQKVWRVIKNLEKNKIIWGYTTIINEESQNMKTFFILIKRSNKPINITIIERAVRNGEVLKYSKDVGLIIQSSHFLFGNYDWILEITAKNVKEVKKFCELLNYNFDGYIADYLILENLFTTSCRRIDNPESEKLYDFFSANPDKKIIKSKINE